MSAAAPTSADAYDLMEHRRADAVHATGLFGTEPEEDFNELVELAL